jgi:hypothetical protein
LFYVLVAVINPIAGLLQARVFGRDDPPQLLERPIVRRLGRHRHHPGGAELLFKLRDLVLDDSNAVEVGRIDHEGRMRRIDQLVLPLHLLLEISEEIGLRLAMQGETRFIQKEDDILPFALHL